MKHLMFFLSAMLCLACGCTTEKTDIGSGDAGPMGELLTYFRLEVGETGTAVVHHGDVDYDSKIVTVKGITDGKSVSGVDAGLAEGASIAPDPLTFVGDWPESVMFTVSLDGRSEEYTVVLPDFVEEESPVEPVDQGKVTLAYLMTDYLAADRIGIISWEDLTHVITTFAYVNADGTLNTSVIDRNIKLVTRTAHANDVKVIMSFGGPGTGFYTEATETPQKREALATAMWEYVEKTDCDGLDIDFEEYDSVRDPEKLANLLALFSLLDEKKPEGMVMTSTIAGAWLNYGTEWHTYFDYVSIMSYDYNVSAGKPVQHSPWDLFIRDTEFAINTEKMPRSKVCPGVPFYGNTWDEHFLTGTTADHRTIALHQIVNYYKKDYPDIASMDQIGNTLWNGKNLISRKCQYIMENDLGGIMIWQLTHDADEHEDQLLPVIGEELQIRR